MKEQMFVLQRDYVLGTLKGHSFAFKKGVPLKVAPNCVSDAIAIGAIPVDGVAEDLMDVGEKAMPVEPGDPIERNPLILAAITELFEKNDRDDFTAAGAPTVAAVSEAVGFKVQGKEIAGVLQAYHDAQAEQQ